jgi:short-subunit dehydrogenase
MVVFPGGINSNILDNSGIEANRRVEHLRKKLSFLLLSPRKAAKIILRGIDRNRLRLTPGIDAVLMDFFSRICPCLGPRLIHGLIQSILRL